MIENENSEQAFYHYKGFENSIVQIILMLFLGFCYGMLLMLVIIAITNSFYQIPEKYFQFVFYSLSAILGFLFYRQEKTIKSSYKIYQDRIEFFNETKPLKVDVIDLNEIDQVRYEDDFGRTYSNSPRGWFIYCYFKNGYKSKSKKIKKDRLKLPLKNDVNRIQTTIKILHFFKKKKKQIYISTKHLEINEALGLKNWTQP